MVTANTKYDTTNGAHTNITSNYRAIWKECNGTILSNNAITDEEIFNLWRDHYCDDYEAEGFEDYDKYLLELLNVLYEQISLI